MESERLFSTLTFEDEERMEDLKSYTMNETNHLLEFELVAFVEIFLNAVSRVANLPWLRRLVLHERFGDPLPVLVVDFLLELELCCIRLSEGKCGLVAETRKM